MDLDQLIKEGAPQPMPYGQTYREYLGDLDLLDKGFSFREIVSRWRWNRKRSAPPRALWHRMPLTLALANVIRSEWGRPLDIVAAYRPRGGSKFSQHKQNAALDLDARPKSKNEAVAWFECLVNVWCEFGPSTDMGLGLYTAREGSVGGIRGHIDTGKKVRSWQGCQGSFIKPWWVEGKREALPVRIAYDLGLDIPTRADI